MFFFCWSRSTLQGTDHHLFCKNNPLKEHTLLPHESMAILFVNILLKHLLVTGKLEMLSGFFGCWGFLGFFVCFIFFFFRSSISEILPLEYLIHVYWIGWQTHSSRSSLPLTSALHIHLLPNSSDLQLCDTGAYK